MSAQHPADRLRFRLPSFRRKLAAALALTAEAFRVASRPYVAFSGGKDSLCALALARHVRPDVAVIWGDDELEHDEQLTYIPALASVWRLDLTVVLSIATHAEWFTAWTSDPPWRPPLPGAVPLDARIRPWTLARGYDACILGLRAEEAGYRRRYLRARGRLHQTVDGQWRCNPLAGWTTDEVWALIAGWGLPYNPVYDRLAAVGVPRADQRVGPLPLSPGWVLRAGWPDLYARLVARYGQQWSA